MPLQEPLQGEQTMEHGLSGVGYNATLALYSTTGWPNKLQDAFVYRNARIANLSFKSGCSFTQTHQDVITDLTNAGMVIVAASGN